MNWPEVFFFYSLPVRKPAIKIVFRDGRILYAPKEYPFESISESILQNVYARFGFDAQIVIDIGSSIGDFLVCQSRASDMWYVFEPDPKLFRWLSLNLQSNDLNGRVVAYNAPVSGQAVASICDRVGQVDFLKIDCEGCEYEMLAWPRAIFKRIRKIAAEMHDIGGERPHRIVSFLEEMDFDVNVIQSRGKTSYLYGSRSNSDSG